MVRNSLVRHFLTGFARWVLIFSMMSAAVSPTSAWAQQSLADFESPIIEHDAKQGSLVGGVEVFGATVVDNVNVQEVSLFYRFTGETEYAELAMREVASSSYYSAKVDTANVPKSTDTIEYYIQAKDTSGNVVLRGFAFQPLSRPFQAKPEPQVAAAPEPASEAATSKFNWIYVALGVLAVGGLIAAGNDSGKTSEPEQCDDICTVTLNIELPR